MPTETEIDAAADAINECMQNDAWIPTMGITKQRLERYIRIAAQKALEAAEAARSGDA